MPTLKNTTARLITINHGGKRIDVKCGNNPPVDVPDDAVKLPFVQNLIKTGQLLSVVTVVDVDDNCEQIAELKAMTVAELKEHCKLLDLSGYSRMNESELIELIIKNS